ncbi:SurA N-terminal domain-containing protein [Antarcticimicrobium sediminis]|uniref:Peptidylprolyl isomerase n=1 Tax=Antarcticimicrobium sediminis TaxID=2546227 RepID=A0A4R5F007_9RHOB|nr:SurA N-terminal domain-containing protein [Antarcticimicrobium sediminis]TDE40704.1 peptidylprolyl isomerase [Antarcticimicrobium sediminis]
MAARVKQLSKTFVWILLGLLIAGLAGFGATNLSGTVRTVATVGDQTVSVDAYARDLQREIRAVEAQTGQAMQMSEARARGLDQQVLARLISLASIDNEVAELGLSVGDAKLQQEVMAISAFQGPDGKFDRESYRFALDQAGLNEAEFEADLRAEAARTLVQGAIIDGVSMPDTLINTLVDYVAARRSFTVATLTATDLDAPLPEPDESALQAYYDAHPEQFTLPETKQITYVTLTPEMILDQVEVDDAALRQLYEDRSDDYSIPERRLIERLVFPDEAAASSAMAQIEVGGTTFEALVKARGLALSDVDMGDMSAAELGTASVPIFAADMNQVVGPLPSDLGPALYRVNGKLEARETSFEDASDELRDELAGERARRLIETRARDIDDLLAGGATLEDLAKETDMELGQIDWTSDSADAVAAYDAFREVAQTVSPEDFPEVGFLEDGGIFALRLDDTLAPRPEPFESARARVIEGWQLQQTGAALTAQAEALVQEMGAEGDFAAVGLDVQVETGLTRTAYLDGTPPDFMTQVFEMEPGALRVIGTGDRVQIVRLDAVLPPETTADLDRMRSAFGQELDQALAQALFDAFARDAQLRAHPMLDQRAVNAVQSSFQ